MGLGYQPGFVYVKLVQDDRRCNLFLFYLQPRLMSTSYDCGYIGLYNFFTCINSLL